ncbi:16S rRNA (cytosine(1402)-N(4))-methyltransferase RsmH [Patescibacteria group bacterium]|nr:16S rRNA (cytosine(1402)-N(4))-methyltransferase RsmH [Patescibacteria group bacterium]
MKFKHIPAMVKESIEFLAVKPDGIYVDATLGGGGHAATVLRKSKIQNPKSKIKIVGIDQDIEAINFAKKRLKKFGDRVIFVHNNFRDLDSILNQLKIKKVDGILLDLGVSSYQLDDPSRGFSFKTDKDIKLDMRMDRRQKLSAQDVVNDYSEEKLKRIFFELGEEPYARQIARAVVNRRQEKPIKTTNNLLDIIRGATPPKYRFSRHGHYASKIFRAIRMEVNQELKSLQEVLPQAVDRLKAGGRLVIISFHSLEDRIVKHFFRQIKNEDKVEILFKKPLQPSQGEIRLNPRSESAKMRVVEKIC